MTSLSKRASNVINRKDTDGISLLEYQQLAEKNLFNVNGNPGGIVNLGTSENKLMFDILQRKLATVNLSDFPERHTQYCDMRGTSEFRESLAKFLDHYMKPLEPIDKDNLFVFNGCDSVIEMLAFAMCDAGEGVLVPSPCYSIFDNDFRNRMQSVVHMVALTSKPNKKYGETKPFELSAARLQDAYSEATQKGIKVKGIILTNPHNPLGIIYNEKELMSYIDFAAEHKLHVIIDEIYSLSVFQENASMVSGLALKNVPDPDRLHIVWGFSKDLALSGFRCGLVHTWNQEIKKVLHTNIMFQSVSTVAQYVLKHIIDDLDWLDNVYFSTNRKRLREAHAFFTRELKTIGIEVVSAEGETFVWADFRKFVRPLTRQTELKLFHSLMDHGVFIPPGMGFCSTEVGWFRIIVTVGWDSSKVGIERLKEALKMFDKLQQQ